MSFAKQIIGGTSAITMAGVGARMLAFLTVPILSPLLGPEPYGVVALVGTTTSIAAMFALLGIDMAYARFALDGDPTRRRNVERFCWRFAIGGGGAMALITGGGWYWFGEYWIPDNKHVAAYVIVAIVLSVLATMAQVRRRVQSGYRRVALALLGSSILATAVTLGVALLWRHDLWALLFGTVSGSLATILILGLPSAKLVLSPARLPSSERNALVSLGLAGAVTAPMYWLISSVDRWFIGHYWGVAEIGVYSMAASLALIGLMLNSSLTLIWYPEISRAYSEHGQTALDSLARMWSRLVAGLAVMWVTVSAGGGDMLRLLAAPAFHEGAQFIPWIAGGVFFYGVASLANTALFLNGRMRYAAYFWAAGAIICLLLNFILVPTLGALGAAVAQSLSYMAIAIGIMVTAQKVLFMPIPWARLGIVLTLALISGVLMAPAWNSYPIHSLLLKLPIGILVVATLFQLIAPDWFYRILKRIAKLILLNKTS